MASARQVMVEQFKKAMPGPEPGEPRTTVKGYAEALDITAPTLLILPTRIAPSKEAPAAVWSFDFDLVCVTSGSVPTEKTEAELDNLVMDVIAVLESGEVPIAVTWSEAVRGGYPASNPTRPAYSVAVNASFEKAKSDEA